MGGVADLVEGRHHRRRLFATPEHADPARGEIRAGLAHAVKPAECRLDLVQAGAAMHVGNGEVAPTQVVAGASARKTDFVGRGAGVMEVELGAGCAATHAITPSNAAMARSPRLPDRRARWRARAADRSRSGRACRWQ